MRYVLKLMVLAVFAASASLMVGCGDAKTDKDTKKAKDDTKTENVSKTDSDSSPAKVSKVSFDVEGMA